MTTFARIIQGAAVDVVTQDPAGLFHPDLVKEFVQVPDGTASGDRFDGQRWTKAPAPVAIEPRPITLELLTPMTFYLAFTPAERIAIKASEDELVKEFWSAYQLAVQLDKPVDPNLKSVSEAVAYLAQGPGDTPPGPGILASKERISQILAGVSQ